MEEPIGSRVARVEEGLVSLHGKIDAYHRDVREILAPLKEKQEKQGKSLTVLERDRFWIFTLIGFMATTVVYAVFKT